MLTRRLLMMEGVPGSGKSVLAEALGRSLRHGGRCVDLVPEEAIFTRDEFTEVGEAFKRRIWPTPHLMLGAYRRLFGRAPANDDVVFDWNAVSMIEDLPCADPRRSATTSEDPTVMPDRDVLAEHAASVRGEWGQEAILFVLDVSVEIAIARAAQQRGEGWLERESNRTWARSHDGSLLERAVALHRAFAARRRAIVEAHEDSGWRVVHLNARAGESTVAEEAFVALPPYA